MNIKKFESEEEWLEDRLTKITGSRLKDIVVLRGTNEKVGFWQLVSERLSSPRDKGEKVMERGHNLEIEAINICSKELEKEFITDLVMWERSDNPSIAVSPDAYTKDLKEACEVKCLNSAEHIKCYYEKHWPEEYKFQFYQYFIVNDYLEKLHVILYDPSVIEKCQYIRFEIKRKDIEKEIEKYKEYQIDKLNKVSEIVNSISF